MKKGTLFVISGPSGCGKGTVLKEVLKNPDLYFSVSATTRDPRPGEVDGVNYRFMTNEAFEATTPDLPPWRWRSDPVHWWVRP